ncbi:hypothetical protein [Gordonia shandongensis]|uniref:hypothetical protein n=1 Tax=Gordonia shandongensis TaxID=376351 RepID=UPI00040CBCB1|nr:hypothetical protein [Gordonia shandongensis]
MAHIDLYRAFGLDRHASSDRLGQILAEQAAAADPTVRHQFETARAILADPARRAAYDARLADPAAPELTPAALDEIASAPPTSAPAPSTSAPVMPHTRRGRGVSVPVLTAIAAVLVIAVAAVGVFLISTDSDDRSTTDTQADTSRQADAPDESAAPDHSDAPAAPEPTAPVPGAYAAAGGPRPATAQPLPTYVSRYGKLKSAHLLTPTGGIGCDFQTADSDGKQGQCGVRSMNTTSSPLGTERIGGSIKGKWLFGFAGNRVEAPHGSTGTTGWMNQPANDGYQVPRAEYGKQYYFDDWVCASEYNGLTCWNTTTGSGVFLSNERAETFDGPGAPAPRPPGDTAEPIVLGSPQSNGRGYGSSQPGVIDLGGASSTSVMTGITWTDWGSDRATGTGVGTYQPPNKSGVHKEANTPGNVIAFAPGTCSGKRAYTKIVYFFPDKGQTFDEANAIDICTPR